jgi:hypothetical protein
MKAAAAAKGCSTAEPAGGLEFNLLIDCHVCLRSFLMRSRVPCSSALLGTDVFGAQDGGSVIEIGNLHNRTRTKDDQINSEPRFEVIRRLSGAYRSVLGGSPYPSL